MIGGVDGYFKESHANKYLTFSSTDNNKKVLEKNTKLWNEIKDQIKTINNGNSVECNYIEYDKNYMRSKFTSDDDLPLNKILKLRMFLKKMVNTTQEFS